MAWTESPDFTDGILTASKLQSVSDAINDSTTRVGCRLRRAAVQSIPNNTLTDISWDTEDEDTDGFIAVTGATITIPSGKDGIYAITLFTDPTALAAATRVASLLAIGGTVPTGTPSLLRNLSNLQDEEVTLTAVLPLSAASTIKGQILHNEGSAQDFLAWISCYRIGV